MVNFKGKRILSCFITVVIVLMVIIQTISASASTGDAEVTGNLLTGITISLTGYEPRSIITLLVTTHDENRKSISSSDIVYVDQEKVGANGELTFSFRIGAYDEIDIRCGSNIDANKKLNLVYDSSVLIYGDLNSDCVVSLSDVRITLQWATGETTIVERKKAAADVDGDGNITLLDALLVLRKSTGRITSFPVEETIESVGNYINKEQYIKEVTDMINLLGIQSSNNIIDGGGIND